MVGIGSLSTTSGLSTIAHVSIASEHKPALLRLEDRHRHWRQPDVCNSNGKHTRAVSYDGLPMAKRQKTDTTAAGTIDNPICVDDSSGSSGGLSPFRLNDVCDSAKQGGSIKDDVIIFQELEQPHDETLPLQSLTGECSTTVPDTTTETQGIVVLDNCSGFDTSSADTPFSLSSIDIAGEPPIERHGMSGNVDITQNPSSHVVNYGYNPVVLKTERQADILGFVSSCPRGLTEEGIVMESSHSAIPELSCVMSETVSQNLFPCYPVLATCSDTCFV